MWATGGGVFSLGLRVGLELRVAVGWGGGKGQLTPVFCLTPVSLGKAICVGDSVAVVSGGRVGWMEWTGNKITKAGPNPAAVRGSPVGLTAEL